MSETMLAALTNIRTAEDMIVAFRDEEQCRRLLESMVWPAGRVCPACGYKRSIAIAGRDMGKRRARPGLYQCSSGECRFQFTVTTHTPLHSTKLPLSVWLKGMWLILQSDKGLSSVRLAEALGVSQPTAWRMGHALRLMAARAHARWHGGDRPFSSRWATENKSGRSTAWTRPKRSTEYPEDACHGDRAATR